MKKAIMALDGGGSNLRMIMVDSKTEKPFCSKEVNYGTNLSTVPNKETAIKNIINLITEGYSHLPEDYILSGIGLSSAGTEIEEHKKALEEALKLAVEGLKKTSPKIIACPPKLYVTNDIDILLHSSDIALVAGTGTVGAVKYKDIKPYDNTDEVPTEYTIDKMDGAGPYIGDKGAGYWIAKEVLSRVSEIENLGAYMNSNGEIVEENDSYLRELVIDKLFKANGLSPEMAEKAKLFSLQSAGAPEYVALVYSATEEDGKPFDRAKVGNLFASLADEAALQGDEAANDILKGAAMQLFKNVRAAYQKGGFDKKEHCSLLLSGSVLVHSSVTRYFLENLIKDNYPNITTKINTEKPVYSTVKYVKSQMKTVSRVLPEEK